MSRPIAPMVRRDIEAPNRLGNLEPGAVFRVVWECGHCTEEIPITARFCPWCGIAIDPETRP